MVKVIASDVRKGNVLELEDGKLYVVMSHETFRPGKGTPTSTLVLHSDGLHSKWDLSSYAGLIARHPAVIGGALLRDFRRERDDVSVVVTKAA